MKAPIAYGPWEGEKQVTQDSPICIQRDPYRRDNEIVGSEDCLYLNVYTPEVSFKLQNETSFINTKSQRNHKTPNHFQ